VFHELATPILYHSIVINDLPSLVKGLSAYEGPQTITRKTQRKDQLVAKTKHLRMVGFGPTGRPAISLGSLLEKGGREGRKRWTIVGIPLKRGLELSREMAIQELIDLQDHEDIDYPLRENPAFTSLEAVVIGQRFDRGWDHLNGEILEMTDMQLIRKRHVGYFVSVHRPHSICIHNNLGPYGTSFIQHGMFEDEHGSFDAPGPIITRHFYDDFTTPLLLPGACNRRIMYPGVINPSAPLQGSSHPARTLARDMSIALRFMLGWRPLEPLGNLDRNRERWDHVDAKTSVELYGHVLVDVQNPRLLPPETATPETVPSVPPLADWPVEQFKEVQDHIFQAREMLRVMEADVNRMMVEILSTHYIFHIFTGQWKNRFKFMCWHEAPTCKCCGWSTDVHWRERIGQLEPSQESECRALWGDGGHKA
jgi:hypothetical protein